MMIPGRKNLNWIREKNMTHTIPELDRKGLRQFGLLAACFIVGVFGLLFPWIKGGGFPVWPWLLGSLLFLWALIAPLSMNPLYRVWMRVANFIGSIINVVILSTAYFLVLFPIGLFRRLIGSDPLTKTFAREAETYRIVSKMDKKEKMEKPF